jgi:CO/xanthine dehydrogenase Mo-binding subunit/aerobic-type carbon monoxide dehydrogenase small subunit (CoxS/CutS family)
MIRTFTFRLNGKAVKVSADEEAPLLFVLRNGLGLNGPKSGCDAAQCGACAVLRNGVETPSCTMPVYAADGSDIVTSEGLDQTEQTRALQTAFFEEQASQCGFCIPGMMIGAAALLANNPSPTVPQIKAGLERHICRCGTHSRIIRAVRRVASGAQPSTAPSAGRVKHEAAAKSTKHEAADSWISVARDGRVTAYCGKIDMGTGVRTAFAQLVAEELDVPIEMVDVVLGDTGVTPDQGKSTASCGVMTGGQPLQVVARETRTALLARAAEHWNVDIARLDARDGAVFDTANPGKRIVYGDLIGNRPLRVDFEVIPGFPWGPSLKGKSPLKSPQEYRYVGTSVRRQAVADHISGALEYVHNVRIPGMLHGRVVRPSSYAGKLIAIDESSVAHIPDVQIVRRGDFVGVVAEREEFAVRAARQLKVQWTPSEVLYDPAVKFEELRKAKRIEEQVNIKAGDVDAALATSAKKIQADFHVGYQLHAMLGPSCAVADVRPGEATIWSGGQWPLGDRADIAKMLGLPVEKVRIIWREAAGSYGRLGCDDAAADAAVMSHAVGRPVRVQWTREDENGWEPVSTAQTMSVRGSVDAHGRIDALDYVQWSSGHSTSERGGSVAWRLLGTAPGYDRLSGYIRDLPYEVPNMRGRSIFVQPTFRTIYMRGPGSFQSHFATESFMDELAMLAGVDPIEFRLRHLPERDCAVVQAVARLADWKPGVGPRKPPAGERMLQGTGVAFTRHGQRATFVAMIAEVQVDRETGLVKVTKVCVAQDCGLIVNPDGVRNQLEGNVIHALSRSLKEEVRFTKARVTSLDWNSYPVARFSDVPEIKVDLIQRLDMPPSVVGEVASLAMPAAIANAIFDATGKRLREAPFSPARVRECPSIHEGF